MYKKILLLTLVLSSILSAEVKDKWRINLGSMYVTEYSTQMQMSPVNSGLSYMLDTSDTLGMDYESSVFRLDGYYRFTPKHSVDFSYFRVKSDGTKETQDFTFKEFDISAGASVNSYFNMDTYKVNYCYSFYHNEKVELALSAGLHVTKIELGLSAEGHITNTQTGETLSYIGDVGTDVTVPLPVMGFKGAYAIIEKKFFVSYRSEYFKLAYDGYEGDLISSALTFEYRFYEHYGIGLGYNANKINLKIDDGEYVTRVRNTISGFMLNLNYTY
jgi:hypothetical protein